MKKLITILAIITLISCEKEETNIIQPIEYEQLLVIIKTEYKGITTEYYNNGKDISHYTYTNDVEYMVDRKNYIKVNSKGWIKISIMQDEKLIFDTVGIGELIVFIE